jgi:hypothetical protein
MQGQSQESILGYLLALFYKKIQIEFKIALPVKIPEKKKSRRKACNEKVG